MDPHSLATAFSVWAAIVALVGAAIVYELARMRSQIVDLTERLTSLTVEFEHRLTLVESDIRRCVILGNHQDLR